jgi:1,4-dihydroxy-2-naphthoate octaprenyltransferase
MEGQGTVGRRTLIEIFFIVAGLVMAGLLTHAAIWAYPLGREPILWSGIGGMVATVAMGLAPLRHAIRLDRAAHDRRGEGA